MDIHVSFKYYPMIIDFESLSCLGFFLGNCNEEEDADNICPHMECLGKQKEALP